MYDYEYEIEENPVIEFNPDIVIGKKLFADIYSDSYNDIKELGIERMVTPERTENHRKTICALIAKEYSAIHQEGS